MRNTGAVLVDGTFQTLLAAEFSDIDLLCHNAQHWDILFRPLISPPRGQPIASMLQGRAGRFDYSYARFLVGLDQRGAPPAGKFTFTIPGLALHQLWWRGHTTGANDILVFTPSTELASFSGADFEVHLISFGPEQLADYAERRGLRLPEVAHLPHVFKAPDRLLRSAQRAFGLIQTNPGRADSCDLDLLAEELVGCWLTQAGIQPRKTSRNASAAVVEQLLGLVSTGEIRDLRISELCAQGGISRRALELTFRDRFGISPSAFLKRMRLLQAHRDLAAASGVDDTVGDIMDRVGFSHVGRFAQDYRSIFGELPSSTLAQGRL